MKFLPKTNRIPAVTARELGRNVAETLDRVEDGEPILILRRGRPIATIQPLEQSVVRRALEERRGAQLEPEPPPAEPTEPPPDLTDVQWTVLEAIAIGEHSDATIRKIGGDARTYGVAKGWLELRGFIERRPPFGFGYQPTPKGLQALDARSERDEDGAVS